MQTEAQMGRPPLKDSQRKKNRVVLLFTDDELRRFNEYIEANGYGGHNDLGREAIFEKIESSNSVSKPKSGQGDG